LIKRMWTLECLDNKSERKECENGKPEKKEKGRYEDCEPRCKGSEGIIMTARSCTQKNR